MSTMTMMKLSTPPLSQSIAEVAARVRQPASLQAALKAYEDLKVEHAAATDELRRQVMNHREAGPLSQTKEADFFKVQAELDTLARKVAVARDGVARARPAYGKSVQ